MEPGERVAQVMETQGRRKDWIAAKMGISQSYLSKLLSGERPWSEKLRVAVAEALGVPDDVLFFDLEDRPADDNGSLAEDNPSGAQQAA